MKKHLLLILALIAFQICTAQTYNFQQAMDAIDAEDYEKALDYLNRELNDNPQDPVVYYYRALLYENDEQNALALTDLNTTIKYCKPKDKSLLAGAYSVRARIYVKIEFYEKALTDYATAIKLTPDDPDYYMDRAQVYFDLEQYDKAEADYRKIIKIDEGDVRAWVGLGRNYTATKRFDEAEKILDQAIILAADYNSGYYFRGKLFYEQGKYNEAIEDMFECMVLDEEDADVRDLFIEYSAKNYTLGFSKINSQIAETPEKDRWYFVRAQLYEANHNFKDALADYTKMLSLCEIVDKNDILSLRAQCYASANLHRRAIADFDECLALDSSDAFDYAYRGSSWYYLGGYEQAAADYTKAISMDPTETWFYFKRGGVKQLQEDYNGALSDYNESISLDKEFVYSYLKRGTLYDKKLDNPLKAREDFQSMLSLDTAVHENGNRRHYALFKLGRTEEAQEWLNKTIKEYPNASNYYDAACVYSLMNKPQEAIAHLDTAFEKGFWNMSLLPIDDDLDNIRDSSRYIDLVAKWESIHAKSLETVLLEDPADTEQETETVSIPMKSKGSGVYEVPCKINELALNLILDTGASDISISQTEALFMLKNGYLSNGDFAGSQRYMDANGDIEVGTKIILRKVDFGGLVLNNISASVVNNKNAPLLFGQSALGKYGKIEIDNESKTITITTKVVK